MTRPDRRAGAGRRQGRRGADQQRGMARLRLRTRRPVRHGLDEGGWDESRSMKSISTRSGSCRPRVTNEQYENVWLLTSARRRSTAWGTDDFWAGYDTHPVTQVTWEQAASMRNGPADACLPRRNGRRPRDDGRALSVGIRPPPRSD